MEFRHVGTTGISASSLCVGVAFRGLTESDCMATIERAVEKGINFFDCANVYGRGWSERVLGQALTRLGRRDQFVITTKVGQKKMSEEPFEEGLSRDYILAEIDRSLQRLKVDYVDIYLMHQPDPAVALEESLQAMDEVVRQGKARCVGISNHHVGEVLEMLWVSERLGLSPPKVLQYQYSLLNRWHTEYNLIPLCERHGLGLMTYSPLAVGLLTGLIRKGGPIPVDSPWSDRTRLASILGHAEPVIVSLLDTARELGKTPAQVAIAWLLANPAVSVPVLGPDLPEHVDELVGAIGWQLSSEQKALLDDVSSFGGPFMLDKGSLPTVPRRHLGGGTK